jgi:uncharacterized membrane protein
MKKDNHSTTTEFVQLALLVAIILIMAFTPIGYIKTLGLEITLIVVPVAVGAVALGPKGGAVLGAIFGITSFIQSFTTPFGAMMLGINPVGTFITCVAARVLVGLFTGLIYKALRKKTGQNLSIYLASLSCPLLNTVLFMSFLILFFYQTDYIQGIVTVLGAANPFVFVILFVGINGLVEATACFVVGSAILKVLLHIKR